MCVSSVQEESVGASRRRGPPTTVTTDDADIGAFSAQAEETRETLRRLRKLQCAGFHKPYLIVGIDWSRYIDGQEVTGFGKWLACVADRHSSPTPSTCPVLLPSSKAFHELPGHLQIPTRQELTILLQPCTV